jgi:CheY-like chemotaxis protein
LLSNAIKFSPDGGTIGLEVTRLDNSEDFDSCVLEIRVIDTGIGISKEQQGKLFQSFAQVDSSISRRFGGTGLGLVISQKIAEMMEGNIHIESELGQGAMFIVKIKVQMPRASEQTAETYTEEIEKTIDDSSEKSVEESSVEDLSGKHILLAEDVEINREIVIAILEDYKLEITEAENGQQAFEKFATDPEKYDLIFMDIHMPGVNGYEATRFIRALDHPCAKTVPIIAMTANVFKEDIERCLAVGMNGHLGKPLNFDELLEVLKRYLGKSRQPA